MGSDLSVDELEEPDWARITRRLTVFALRRVGGRWTGLSPADLAQEAIGRFLEPGYAGWDRERQPKLEDHLGSIVNGLVANATRRKGAVIDGTLGAHQTADLPPNDPADPAPPPDVKAATEDACRSAVDLLLARVENDPLCTEIVFLALDGVEDAAAQAKKLGRPVADLYNARRRLAKHREEVICELGLEEHDG